MYSHAILAPTSEAGRLSDGGNAQKYLLLGIVGTRKYVYFCNKLLQASFLCYYLIYRLENMV